MRSELNFPLKPILPFVDAYLSCILSESDYEYSIAENFIRCFIDESIESSWIDYYNSYKYTQYGVFRGFNLSSDNFYLSNLEICDVIDDSLEHDYLVMYSVDTFHISRYPNYKKQHLIHPLLIYKTNLCNDSYVCRDYFNFTTYSEELITKKEISDSYHLTFDKKSNYYSPIIIGFKLDANNSNVFEGSKIKKDIDLEKILFFLKEFVEGTNYFKNDCDYISYGITFFKTGIDIFDTIRTNITLDGNETNENIKLKHLKFLEHHIYLMKERIRILHLKYNIDLNENLFSQVTKILEESGLLVNMAIKFNFNKQEMLLLRIYKKLDFIKYGYKVLILQLIKDIELCNNKK